MAKRNYNLTNQGREKLRQTIRQNQPWLKSTGPRTVAGKAKVALNGKRTKGSSVRELQAEVSEIELIGSELSALRQYLEEQD